MRRWFAEQAAELFRQFDVLLAPCTPCSATTIGQATLRIDGKDFPARASIGLLTQPLSCVGLPVAAVPIRRPGVMPIGVQVIAPPWHELRALQIAARLEACGIAGSEAPA